MEDLILRIVHGQVRSTGIMGPGARFISENGVDNRVCDRAGNGDGQAGDPARGERSMAEPQSHRIAGMEAEGVAAGPLRAPAPPIRGTRRASPNACAS